MTKIFKLLENELDMLFAGINGVHKTAKSVETIADYILENDDKTNYTKGELDLVKEFAQEVFNMYQRFETEAESILKMRSKIIDLY